MAAGLKAPAWRTEVDRRAAIDAAIADADAADVVLIAGKGRETTQEIAGVFHPFSDPDVARASCSSTGPPAPPSPCRETRIPGNPAGETPMFDLQNLASWLPEVIVFGGDEGRFTGVTTDSRQVRPVICTSPCAASVSTGTISSMPPSRPAQPVSPPKCASSAPVC